MFSSNHCVEDPKRAGGREVRPERKTTGEEGSEGRDARDRSPASTGENAGRDGGGEAKGGKNPMAGLSRSTVTVTERPARERT